MNSSSSGTQDTVDAVVVGAGFAGMFAVYRLREMGLSVKGFERGGGVGGTWYWNRYPGARCDAPSMQYSYQFSDELQQDWHWTEKFAAQPEILQYCNHVASRFRIRDNIQFETEVTSAHFDEKGAEWIVTTDRDDCVRCKYLIMASGCLSTFNLPQFEGLEDFHGEWYHTGTWPQEPISFTGKRVGVVGTGSTGIQVIPIVAEQAEHLTVFQRTAQYSTPAMNEATNPEYEARIKADYKGFRERNYRLPLALDIQMDPNAPKTFEVSDEERRAEFERRWKLGGMSLLLAFRDSTLNRAANEAVSDFIRGKIEEIVDNKEVAELLKPKHIYGCKRPCIDNGYFETYNRDNVTLVDASSGIERISKHGIVVDGQEYPLDCIIFATGFDAMTGALNRIDIRGRGGKKLKHKWQDGPRCYLGLSSAGFPNLFTVSGPGSPSVLTNMVATIEQHVNWIAACIEHLRQHGLGVIEAEQSYEDGWLDTVQVAAERTLWGACDNWYTGANIPGKPRVFMPYPDWPAYLAKCEEVAANGYEGFNLS